MHKGGIDIAVTEANDFMTRFPHGFLLQLDLSNAFNEITKQQVYQALLTVSPEYARFSNCSITQSILTDGTYT